MLVVDADALGAVDGLHFAEQVVLHRLLALDREHVVRHERAVDQRFASLDVVATVDAQVLALRHQVLALEAALALDEDRALAAPLVAELDDAVDLGQHRRVLRTTRLEQLRDARQTTGDVLRALDLTRGLGEHHAGDHLLAALDLDVGLLRHRRDREAVAAFVPVSYTHLTLPTTERV